jgi:hypothetical protein
LLIEWNELGDHERFQASESYPSLIEKVFGLTTKDSLTLNHIHATPGLNVVTDRAPVVEMLLIYVSASANDEVPGTLTRFLDIFVKNATGFVATSHGWVVEELHKEGVDEKLKGYFVAIGWESVDAHMAYRDTEPFKENIPMVRALAKGLRVVSRHFEQRISVANPRLASYELHELQVLMYDMRQCYISTVSIVKDCLCLWYRTQSETIRHANPRKP